MSCRMDLPEPFREGIEALLKVLDPEENCTGGGTASAIAGAMAAALLAMVGRLSQGRPGMAPESFYKPLVMEAEVLAQELMKGAWEDAAAFELVMAAYRMPKKQEEEKESRRQAIGKALEKATRVPLKNARACARLLGLCEVMEGRFNPKASSDFNCATHLALAALKGCLENVRINLLHLKPSGLAEKILRETTELERRVAGSQFSTKKKC